MLCRYGPLNRVEIKRNYAFVEFKELEDAIDAQKKTHGTNFDGRTITVEFVESSRLGKDRWVRPGLKYTAEQETAAGAGSGLVGSIVECTMEASNDMPRGRQGLPQQSRLCCRIA